MATPMAARRATSSTRKHSTPSSPKTSAATVPTPAATPHRHAQPVALPSAATAEMMISAAGAGSSYYRGRSAQRDRNPGALDGYQHDDEHDDEYDDEDDEEDDVYAGHRHPHPTPSAGRGGDPASLGAGASPFESNMDSDEDDVAMPIGSSTNPSSWTSRSQGRLPGGSGASSSGSNPIAVVHHANSLFLNHPRSSPPSHRHAADQLLSPAPLDHHGSHKSSSMSMLLGSYGPSGNSLRDMELSMPSPSPSVSILAHGNPVPLLQRRASMEMNDTTTNATASSQPSSTTTPASMSATQPATSVPTTTSSSYGPTLRPILHPVQSDDVLNGSSSPALLNTTPIQADAVLPTASRHDVESSYCKNFVCCNESLRDMHELLRHYEEKHPAANEPKAGGVGLDAAALAGAPPYWPAAAGSAGHPDLLTAPSTPGLDESAVHDPLAAWNLPLGDMGPAAVAAAAAAAAAAASCLPGMTSPAYEYEMYPSYAHMGANVLPLMLRDPQPFLGGAATAQQAAANVAQATVAAAHAGRPGNAFGLCDATAMNNQHAIVLPMSEILSESGTDYSTTDFDSTDGEDLALHSAYGPPGFGASAHGSAHAPHAGPNSELLRRRISRAERRMLRRRATLEAAGTTPTTSAPSAGTASAAAAVTSPTALPTSPSAGTGLVPGTQPPPSMKAKSRRSYSLLTRVVTKSQRIARRRHGSVNGLRPELPPTPQTVPTSPQSTGRQLLRPDSAPPLGGLPGFHTMDPMVLARAAQDATHLSMQHIQLNNTSAGMLGEGHNYRSPIPECPTPVNENEPVLPGMPFTFAYPPSVPGSPTESHASSVVSLSTVVPASGADSSGVISEHDLPSRATTPAATANALRLGELSLSTPAPSPGRRRLSATSKPLGLSHFPNDGMLPTPHPSPSASSRSVHPHGLSSVAAILPVDEDGDIDIMNDEDDMAASLPPVHPSTLMAASAALAASSPAATTMTTMPAATKARARKDRPAPSKAAAKTATGMPPPAPKTTTSATATATAMTTTMTTASTLTATTAALPPAVAPTSATVTSTYAAKSQAAHSAFMTAFHSADTPLSYHLRGSVYNLAMIPRAGEATTMSGGAEAAAEAAANQPVMMLTPDELTYRPYACPVAACHKHYRNLNGLMQHIYKTHPTLQPPTEAEMRLMGEQAVATQAMAQAMVDAGNAKREVQVPLRLPHPAIPQNAFSPMPTVSTGMAVSAAAALPAAVAAMSPATPAPASASSASSSVSPIVSLPLTEPAALLPNTAAAAAAAAAFKQIGVSAPDLASLLSAVPPASMTAHVASVSAAGAVPGNPFAGVDPALLAALMANSLASGATLPPTAATPPGALSFMPPASLAALNPSTPVTAASASAAAAAAATAALAGVLDVNGLYGMAGLLRPFASLTPAQAAAAASAAPATPSHAPAAQGGTAKT